MMGEKNQCPICGREYDNLEFTIGENGNLICIYCAQEEGE